LNNIKKPLPVLSTALQAVNIGVNEFTMFKISPWFSYMLIISSVIMGILD